VFTTALPPKHHLVRSVHRVERRIAIFLAALLSFGAPVAMAGDTGSTGTTAPDRSDVPDFISARKEIPAELLDQKKEGTYWIGFPIIGYDPDTLFNIGATVNVFNDGLKDSPFFRYNSYERKIALSAAYSTGGAGQVRFIFDSPNFNASPWHLYGTAQYVKNDFENYFGVGSPTLDALSFPGSNKTYSKYEDFLDAINQVHNGQTFRSYDEYKQQQAFVDFSVERDTLGGILRPMAGIQVAYYDIGDYTGETHDGAVIQTTHLRSDENAGRIKGFNGGWDNSIRLGLTYDTRDFAPNPSNGLFLQAIARTSLKAFGSTENYGQFKLEARGFYSPFPKTRLILAGRLGYLAQTSNTPFYILSQAPGVDGSSNWLGAFDSLRGFQNNRFIGNNVAVASAEVRWFFAKSTIWNQNLAYGTTAFVDAGSVFDSIGDTSLKHWKPSGGVGFLLSWNVSTVVSFDLGKSGEGNLFYMGLGFPF
jgi:outer membrane protein assembly factor BamA